MSRQSEAPGTLHLARAVHDPPGSVDDQASELYTGALSALYDRTERLHINRSPASSRLGDVKGPVSREDVILVEQGLEAGRLCNLVDVAHEQLHKLRLEDALDGACVPWVLAVFVVLAVELLDGVEELHGSGLERLRGCGGGKAAEILTQSFSVVLTGSADETEQLRDLEVVGKVVQAHLDDEGVVGVLVELGCRLHI